MFKHLPVGKKIASIFACIIALLIAVAFLIKAEIDLVRNEIVNLTDSTLPSVSQVEALRYELATIRTGEYAILTYDNARQMYERIERIDRQMLMVNQMLIDYNATVVTQHEQQVFDRFMQNWEVYENVLIRYNHLLNNGKRSEAREMLSKSIGIHCSLDESLSDLRDLNVSFVQNNRISIIQSVDAMLCLAIGSIFILAVFMMVMNIVLTRSICRPLNMVTAQSNAIASGNLTYHFARERIGNDELGQLADSSIKMQNDLRGLIEDISATVTQLSSAIEKVNTVAPESSKNRHTQHVESGDTVMKPTAKRPVQTETVNSEQSSTTEGVSDSVTRTNTSSTAVAQGANPTTQACHELTQLANSLQQKMKRFRLL
ncbi:methyl-accepting chemotaxis protein [Photobacterium japonica]|uniref:MCP four helix bundle domain-containing protein n=1 Tax=Photobacterium japonica TaxID=2910235 RepID=UPI003D118B56